MTLDGTYTAVLDRIEDGLAVLEVTAADETHELVVDLGDLPEEGRHPDAVFEIEMAAGELQTTTYDEHWTESRTEAAQDRFDRLSSRPPQDEGDESG